MIQKKCTKFTQHNLQPYITESSSFRQNVQKEIGLHDKGQCMSMAIKYSVILLRLIHNSAAGKWTIFISRLTLVLADANIAILRQMVQN